MYIQDENGNKKELLLSPSGDTYPIGMYAFCAGDKAPTNWLRCDGQEVSRTEYKELFNVIGTTYGSGDGSTTFNLPNVNLENRTLVGSSGDGEFSIGNAGGEKEHALTAEENGPHKHNLSKDFLGYTAGSTNGIDSSQRGPWSLTYKDTMTSSGNGTPHNNMPPYMAAICCIKAKQSVGIVGDKTDDINDPNENAWVNAKTVKEYVDNSPQVICCKKNTDFVTSQNYINIKDWQELTKVGNAFSIKNGVVSVDSDVKHIKITTKYRYIGKTAGEMLFSYLIKSDKNINGSWNINTLNGDATFINEIIVDAKEGDTITSSIYAGGGTLKADATLLIVEKID